MVQRYDTAHHTRLQKRLGYSVVAFELQDQSDSVVVKA